MSADRFRRDTSARITEATFALLAEHGLAGVTMSAIAARAGIARQTLYNHFPDVESILTAAMSQHQDDELETLGAMLATIPSASGRLEHLIRHTAANAAQHGALPALHDSLSPAAAAAAHQYQAHIRRVIHDTLTQGCAAGEFHPTIDPVVHAVLVHHLLHAAAELSAADPEQVATVSDTTIGLVRQATSRAP